MMIKSTVSKGNYNHDSVFIYIDNVFYIIDTETKFKESLYKYKDEYDIVINFLGEGGTYILDDTYNIGSYYNTCYVFKNIKKCKMKKMFIRSFTYIQIDCNTVLNINDYVLYDKSKSIKIPSSTKVSFSLPTSSFVPSTPLLKYITRSSYDYDHACYRRYKQMED